MMKNKLLLPSELIEQQLFTTFSKNSNNEYHSLNDEPAIVTQQGQSIWMENNQIHRLNDLPAAKVSNSQHTEWRKKGVRHRIGGPAIIYEDGVAENWINGLEINFDIWEELKKETGGEEEYQKLLEMSETYLISILNSIFKDKLSKEIPS